jgi:Ca-activated chloride channel family protein
VSFAEPTWLWGLVALPLLASALALVERARRRRLARFAHAGTLSRIDRTRPSRRPLVRGVLAVAAVGLIFVALARPLFGESQREVAVRGLDLVLVVDLSRSMLAEDLAPSRLVVARSIASKLASELATDRIALVGFAGSAVVLCPLTLDRGALQLYLDALSPSIFEAQGSDVGAAIDEATRQLADSEATRRVVVLLSDGEDHVGAGAEAARRAAETGVTVYAVGLGTSEGAPIPLRDESGRVSGYQTRSDGQPVSTRIDEAVLTRIADEGGGLYVRASGFAEGVDRVVNALEEHDRGELAEALTVRKTERYRWPLTLAFLLALIEASLVDRRRRELLP